MTNPLHARYFADAAVSRTVEILENVQLARDTFRVRFACPEIAEQAVPGQFLMTRLAQYDDPLLGRPLALYDLPQDSAPGAIDLVYLVHGKFTSRLCQFVPGQQLDIWGPLGNGFPPEPAEHLAMVAGGIGQTPFVAMARQYLGLRQFGQPPREVPKARKVTLLYGARSAEYLAGVEDFERLGVEVQIATDDGSRGRKGFVTELLTDLLASDDPPSRVVCCGPEPMMEAASGIAIAASVPCQVSLETPMACGVGICFSCVARVRQEDGEWDWKRTCVEGPVFEAAKIAW